MSVAQARASGVAWGALREPAVRGAQLLAASGFALAQPLFDILGKNAEFFAVRGSTPGDIVLFALAVTFVPALALLAVELVAGAISRPAGCTLHLLFLAFLGAVFGVQALKRAGVDGTVVLIAGAVAVGVLAALAVWRLRAAGTFLTMLGAAPLVFLALFLFTGPVGRLVFPSASARAAAAHVRASTPVVLLLFDEFPVIDLQDRTGAIDAGRFPNFARLAEESTWFRNTSTLSASTTVAVPVILTGQRPTHGALPIFQDHPNNLFTLLGGRYRMVVSESQTRLCPTRLCRRKAESEGKRLSSLYADVRTVYLHLIAPPELEQQLPAIDESWGDFGQSSQSGSTAPVRPAAGASPNGDEVTSFPVRVRDFGRFVASSRPPGEGKPTLYFLHVLFPHAPWLYFPDGRLRALANTNSPGRAGELWWNRQLAVQAWQRHLLQLGYTDRLLGFFLRRLRATGLWDKALVIVTADHGISFRGGDLRRRPTRTNLAELAFTPLFMKLPGETKGRVVERHVRTVDILPTIADVLGIRIPWQVAGHSALHEGPAWPRVDVHGVTASYRAALAQRRAALARQLRLFGSGGWGPELYGTGPYRRLVGSSVGSLSSSQDAGASATVDSVGSKFLRAFPKRGALVPSPLTGTLAGVPVGAQLAFVLHGRVASASVAYRNPAGGPVRFSANLGEGAFRPGRNTLRAFVVSGPVQKPALRELRVKLS